MDEQRAARLAARRNARLRARYPLFAGQLPQETAERVMKEFAGCARCMAACRALLAARAEEYRGRVRPLPVPGGDAWGP